MWKTLLQGQKVATGDTIRYRPSSANLSSKEIVYQVVKTELHYFEVVVKSDKENAEGHADRKVIKYMDIGYHLGVEIWAEPTPVV